MGPAPSGAVDVEIAANEYASVKNTAATWNGTLTMQTNTTLEFSNTVTAAQHDAVLGNVSSLIMNAGARILMRTAANTSDSYNLSIVGQAEYGIGTSTSSHGRLRTLSGDITGSFNLGIRTTNRQALFLTGDNSGFTGGLYIGDNDGVGFGNNLAENNRAALVAGSAEALPDFVQIGDGINLRVDVANTMNQLTMFGADTDQQGSRKLFLNGVDLTVNSATLDGVALAAGTYNISSGITEVGGENFFGGTGNLIVVPEPSSTALLGLGGLALILRRRK